MVSQPRPPHACTPAWPRCRRPCTPEGGNEEMKGKSNGTEIPRLSKRHAEKEQSGA